MCVYICTCACAIVLIIDHYQLDNEYSLHTAMGLYCYTVVHMHTYEGWAFIGVNIFNDSFQHLVADWKRETLGVIRGL